MPVLELCWILYVIGLKFSLTFVICFIIDSTTDRGEKAPGCKGAFTIQYPVCRGIVDLSLLPEAQAHVE